MAEPVAARVVEVELSEPLPEVSADVAGRRYPRAWILGRRFGVPVGVVVLDFPPSGVLGSAELDAAFRRELAAELAEPAVPPVAVPDPPPITVVICTRNRPRSLERTLESLTALDYPSYRVLVVDNAPADDATATVVAAYTGRLAVDYLRVDARGLSRARNAALAARPDEILAWTDDDVTVDPTWLTEAARALTAHPEAAVVCGAVVPAALECAEQIWFEQFGGLVKGRGFRPAVFGPESRSTQSPLYPLPPFGAGANMITRPGVLTRIGGFDTALGAGTPAMGAEDTMAFTRLLLDGGTIVYHPAALVRHTHRTNRDDLRSQLYGYGSGVTAFYIALLIGRPGSIVRLIGLAPRAVHDVLSRAGQREAGISTDFPPDLLAAGRRGMLRGPAAYLRARRADRRTDRAQSAV